MVVVVCPGLPLWLIAATPEATTPPVGAAGAMHGAPTSKITKWLVDRRGRRCGSIAWRGVRTALRPWRNASSKR